MDSTIHQLLMFVNAANKTSLSAASEFQLLVWMQPGKYPEGEIGSLGTTMLASS